MVKLRKNGFTMQGKEAIKRVLANHIYAGLIPVRAYKDDGKKVVKGMHEAIVTEDLFWTAYYKLQDNIKPVTLKLLDENLPLRGFLKCQHCDSPHTGAKCKGRNSYYFYYWCNKCRGKSYGAPKVHHDMTIILMGLSLKKEYNE